MPITLRKFSSKDFDRGRSRLWEFAWIVTKCLFFLTPFPVPSAWRCQFLRMFGATVGRRVVIRSRVNIWFPWRLAIADDVWIGEEVFILNLASVTIEHDVCISQRVFLCTGSHDFRREDFALITKPIVIHESSWIAAQAFVAPGIEIGPRSVVSAGSVVLRNVPVDAHVRGNPAETYKTIE